MISIERLRVGHLPEAVRHSQAAGWPHTLADWTAAFELGSGYVALDDDEVAGAMLWWPQGAHHATLGLAVVASEHQRRGIGQALIEVILAEAGPIEITLCATEAGLPLYERAGFTPMGTVMQHQGIAVPTDPQTGSGNPPKQDKIVSLDSAWRDDIVRLDRTASGRDRSALLTKILATGDATGLQREGAVVGYSMCRAFGKGRVIGPVVAPDSDAAIALIRQSIERYAGEFLRVDSPENRDLSQWLNSQGLENIGRGTTMVKPARNTQAPGRLTVFALASQALG